MEQTAASDVSSLYTRILRDSSNRAASAQAAPGGDCSRTDIRDARGDSRTSFPHGSGWLEFERTKELRDGEWCGVRKKGEAARVQGVTQTAS
jgi:hypothetical protein